MIGPWGWAGWLVAAVLGAILIHLWRSSGPKELRRLNREMAEARKLIAQLRTENLTLTNRNEELGKKVFDIERLLQLQDEEMARVRAANELLAASIAKQDALVGGLTARLGEAEKHIIKIVAAQGGDIDLSNLTGK